MARPPFTPKDAYRYVSDEGEGKCWNWRGTIDKHGYGQIRINQRFYRAHRVIWELANGARLTREMVVRHTCDNPPCCNPAHLVVGTQADNMADMAARGRRKGERACNAILSGADVLWARKECASGVVSVSDAAKRFGVTYAAMLAAVRGRTWKHLP